MTFKSPLILVLLVGCMHDTSTWPTPRGGPWGSGHCSPMFAPEVLGCTYTDEKQRVLHEVCFENEQGSWWCSGRHAESSPPCFLCGPRRL